VSIEWELAKPEPAKAARKKRVPHKGGTR